MATLFSEVSLLAQWAPTIDKPSVMGINRLAQVVVLAAALLGIYPDPIRILISKITYGVTRFSKMVIRILGFSWGKEGPMIQWPPEADSNTTDDELFGDYELKQQLLVSLVLLPILIAIQHIYWGWFPSLGSYGMRIFELWFEVPWSINSVMLGLLESIGRLLSLPVLAFIKLAALIVYWAAWLLVAWAAATLLSVLGRNLNSEFFRAAIAVLMLLSGLLVMFTT